MAVLPRAAPFDQYKPDETSHGKRMGEHCRRNRWIRENILHRRRFLAAAAATFAWPASWTLAAVPKPYSWDVSPPTGSRETFVAWMQENRGEDPQFLRERWDRFEVMVSNHDLVDDRNKRAFLMTPREAFVPKDERARSYEHAFLDIGFGVTISGPHLVGRMTSALDVNRSDKVLEVGTGSGYQSAYLANLTEQVWTIEIVRPLAERTRGVYDALIAAGYSEFRSITSKNADGYYGWEEAAPFDKIIVTCGVDHIPPPLLAQLKVGGVMIIPIGPPGAQHVLKVTKNTAEDGSARVARSDIYGGKIVPFVPFTKLEGNVIAGVHSL
jgi:protein-L-isoaspartate(D-aspartate) O-methyltransferase